MKFAKMSIVLGILSIAYYFCAIIYKISFANFFGVLGLLLITLGLIKLFVKPKTLNRFRYIILTLKIAFFIFFMSFVTLEIVIIYNGTKKQTASFDYIIVLGAMVRGETPSMILQERLDAALPYIVDNPNTKVILSGGKGPGENISEAEAMYRYFTAKGISEDRLIKEDKSTNTLENVKNSKGLINKNSKIAIVSSDFHIFRAEFLAKRNGFNAYGIPADTYFAIKPTYYIREYFAVIKSFIFDKAK